MGDDHVCDRRTGYKPIELAPGGDDFPDLAGWTRDELAAAFRRVREERDGLALAVDKLVAEREATQCTRALLDCDCGGDIDSRRPRLRHDERMPIERAVPRILLSSIAAWLAIIVGAVAVIKWKW